MKRREFPRSVRAAALKRCLDAKGFPRCEACGLAVKAGGFAFDHVNPDGLTGEPTLANCQVLCADCHKGKTASDVARIAKAKRVEARHYGFKAPSARPIPGSRNSPWKRKVNGEVVLRSELARMES